MSPGTDIIVTGTAVCNCDKGAKSWPIVLQDVARVFVSFVSGFYRLFMFPGGPGPALVLVIVFFCCILQPAL